EQAGEMALVVRDPELLLDHLGDAGTGPDLAPEPVSLGTMPEEFGDQTLLAGCKPRGSPRTGTSEESFAATDACASDPAAHRVLRHTKRFRDITPRPAALLQLKCPKPSPFAPVLSGEAIGKHPAILSTGKSDLLCA